MPCSARLPLAFAVAFSLAGCQRAEPQATETRTPPPKAGSESNELPSSTSPPVESLDYEGATKALSQATDAFESAVALADLDCTLVQSLKARICDLAARICKLEGESPPASGSAARCEDAKESCTRAEDRTAERCP
jgi:hypothetical protein